MSMTDAEREAAAVAAHDAYLARCRAVGLSPLSREQLVRAGRGLTVGIGNSRSGAISIATPSESARTEAAARMVDSGIAEDVAAPTGDTK